MNFITVKESSNASDLSVLKSRLESEGINCRIKDELSSQVLNYLPVMSAKLQIIESDLDKVIEILKESGESIEGGEKIICPKCNSEKIKAKMSLKNLLLIFVTLVLAAIIIKSPGNIFKSSNYKCLVCGSEFRI